MGGIPALVFYILAVSASCIHGEGANESNIVIPEGRIIGGQDAIPNEFPHQILLLQREGSSGTLCGASLISNEWILTAAHCATLKPGGTWQIIAGKHSGAMSLRDPDEQVEQPKEIFIHPCYDKNDKIQILNDLALMKLDSPFTLNDKVKIIQLDEKDRAKPCNETTALGWGRINPRTTQNAAVLKKATLNLPAAGFCNKTLRQSHEQSQQCVVEKDSVCHGDSGGPLLCKDGGVNYLCGVASFVADLNCIGGYNVFVRVVYYLNWIKEVMGSGTNSRTNCVAKTRGPASVPQNLPVCEKLKDNDGGNNNNNNGGNKNNSNGGNNKIVEN